MMTNVMVKTCLNQNIIKNSNLIQAMKTEFVKNLPNVPKCGLNTRHDNREVTWSTVIQFFRKPNLSEYLPNVPKCGLNTRHDNREVTLIHLTRAQICAPNAPPVQSTQTGQWPTLFHASECLVPSAIHLRSCRRRSFLQVLQSTEYFETFFLYLMMTNVIVKTCPEKYKNFEFDSGNEE